MNNEFALRQINTTISFLTNQLINEAKHAARDLRYLSEKLAANPDAEFNTLGILQGRGPALDRLCGELGRLREIRDLLMVEETA